MTTTLKGKMLREDVRLYDGVSLSGTRVDPTGTVTGTKIGNDVDVLAVYGDGEHYTGATIQSAINAIGSNAATLVFAPGTWVISSDITIPANCPCRIPAGCVFNVASGITLTFSGPVLQDYATWTSGSGTVTTSANRVINGGLTINGTALTATATELNVLDGITSTTAELNILDGVTSTAAELNILDGVTATAAELNELDASAAAITNFVSGIRHYVVDGTVDTAFDITGNFTNSVAETIGPTGSGADHIWTAMDSIPSGAVAAIIGVYDQLTAVASANSYGGDTKAYKVGLTITGRDDVYLTNISGYNHTGAGVTPTNKQVCHSAIIPLDGSLRFEFQYLNAASVSSRTIEIYLRGFIV